jgi:hypothetical protein
MYSNAAHVGGVAVCEYPEKAVATADIVPNIVFSEHENPRIAAYVNSINAKTRVKGF